jgi:transcriptional regulator with XRE-family HTH domain
MFRERVKAELESRGWSLLRLSRESGVTYSVIQDWLSDDGKSKLGPSTVILEKILAAVGFKMPPMRKPKPPRRK